MRVASGGVTGCCAVTGCESGLHGNTVMRTRAMRASAMCLARMSSESADGHHAEAGATEDKTETIDIHDCFTTPVRGALGERRPRSKLRATTGGCFFTD